MKINRSTLITFLLTLASCTGSQTIDGNRFRMTTIYDANAMVPSGKYAVLEKCDMEDKNVGASTQGTDGEEEDELKPELKNCDVINIQYVSQTGVLSGMMGPVIHGGAAVGAAYLLGEGIADSADRTTTTISQSASPSVSQNANPNMDANSTFTANPTITQTLDSTTSFPPGRPKHKHPKPEHHKHYKDHHKH